jgi:CelD/BcsL family acetyltransferase involved in cellulose biosynthesis
LNIVLYDTEDLFAALRDEWRDVLQDSAASRIFLSPEWQAAWWESYRPGQLWTLVIRDDSGRCQGLAPWFRAEQAGERIIGPIGGKDVTDYLDIIVRRGAEEAVFSALAAWLADHADDFDLIRLHNYPQDSPALTHLPRLLVPKDFVLTIEPEEVCPIIRLPGTFQDYVNSLDQKNRHELRRKLRRAAGEVEWYIVGAGHDLNAEIERFLRLMAASTPDKAEFLANPQHTAFFRRMVHAMAGQGWLQLAFLTVKGEAAAAYLNFDDGQQVMIYNSGLDPTAHTHLSPGIVLLARLIEHAILCKRAVFDFLRGDEAYKYDMGGQDTQVYQIEIRKAGAV